MTRLWAARHAPVRATGLCYGRIDVETRVAAPEAAALLAATFPGQRPRRVWTSPSERCRAVAAALSPLLGAELVVDERLHELSFGRWEGRRWSVIEQEDPAFSAWAADWLRASPPGGESVPELTARVTSFLSDVRHHGEDVLVGHAGVLRALSVLTAGLSWEEAMRAPVPHLEWRAFPASSRRSRSSPG